MLMINKQVYNKNMKCRVDAEAWCACYAQELIDKNELLKRVGINLPVYNEQIGENLYNRMCESIALFYTLRDVTRISIKSSKLTPADAETCLTTGLGSARRPFEYDVKILNMRDLSGDSDICVNFYHSNGEEIAKISNEKYYLCLFNNVLYLKKTGANGNYWQLSTHYHKYLKLIKCQSETCRVLIENSEFGRRSY